MQKSFIEDFFERMSEPLFLVLVVLVQLLFIFQGFNFTESGYTAVFYQRIFSDPSSVQYNFGYWLTGIIGGTWLKLFPGLGLLGLRIAGVICTTVTFGISYNLLKKYLQTAPLRLGLLLIIFFLSTSVKELNHRDITSLFFMCSAWFLYTGLTGEKYSRLFIAGTCIAVNLFVRLPNILNLFLICAVWFSGYLQRIPFRRIAIHSLIFLSGFFTMAASLFLLMKAFHHNIIFFKNLEILRHVSNNQVNTQSLHDTFKPYLQQYALALIVSVMVIVSLWSFAAAWRRMKLEIPVLRGFWPVGKYLILALLTGMCIYHARIDSNFWYWLFLFYLGTSLIIAVLIISGRQPREMQLLSFIGSLMLLILPLGSHALLMTIGKYGMWIMVPITVDYLLNVRSLSSSVVISENRRHTYDQVINTGQMNSLRNGFIFLTFTYLLSDCYFYPYGDLGNRIDMKYEVNNPHVSRIYTTPEKAIAVDELLSETKKYIRPDDYVLAYDGFPVFYYLTDTKPFLHHSWLWLYDGGIFKEELQKSLDETHICPVVIIRKPRYNDPEHGQYSNPFREKTLDFMQGFLHKYQYRQIWENDFFRLFVPQVKQLPAAGS
jgi:hypothetical protein